MSSKLSKRDENQLNLLTLLHVGRGVYQTLVTVIVADPTGAEILDWKLDDNFILGTQ